jgi:hypothetical protein
MSCLDWQDRIAAGERGEVVTEHLAGCAECRELAAALTILREAHAQPLLDADYATVRARVMDGL